MTPQYKVNRIKGTAAAVVSFAENVIFLFIFNLFSNRVVVVVEGLSKKGFVKHIKGSSLALHFFPLFFVFVTLPNKWLNTKMTLTG